MGPRAARGASESIEVYIGEATSVCSSYAISIAMSVDSKVAFAQRVSELVLDDVSEKFTAQAWTAHGSFAHAVTPLAGGQVDDETSRSLQSPRRTLSRHAVPR